MAVRQNVMRSCLRVTLDARLASHSSPPRAPTPLRAHTPVHPLPLSPTLSLHRDSPPPVASPTADSLIDDWCFQVTSDQFPCLPNITGWPRPRNPAWAREGAEVHTHTQTPHKPQHNKAPPHTLYRSYWCRALLHTQLDTFQLIFWLSMVVWLCEDTYLAGMYLTVRRININARKLHLYRRS